MTFKLTFFLYFNSAERKRGDILNENKRRCREFQTSHGAAAAQRNMTTRISTHYYSDRSVGYSQRTASFQDYFSLNIAVQNIGCLDCFKI